VTWDTAPVVTGLGVVAPTGIGVERHWESVLKGRSGIAPLERFDPADYPLRLAGQVPDFTPRDSVPGRLLQQTDRGTHMGLVAAAAALDDAGIDPADVPEFELAVVTAASSGGTEFGQHEMERLYQNGPGWVGAYQSIAWFYAATTGQISIRHGMRGPSGVLCQEQAGGLDTFGQARRLLRGGSRVVVAGGTDASLCPYGVVAQLSTRALSTATDPDSAYRPFAPDACGYVPGEGGAMLVVERSDAAAARGARTYGRVLGHAAGFDPAPVLDRPPALASTIERALADAGVAPGAVGAVFADAMGVPAADAAEAAALRAVFGPGAVPVTAPKTLTGRLYGGGSSLDVATAVLALHHQVVPHTAGLDRPDPRHGVDLVVGGPRPAALDVVVVLARGHGGFTSALVLGRGDTALDLP